MKLRYLALLLCLPASAMAGVGKLSSPWGIPKGELESEYAVVRTGDRSGDRRNNAQSHVVEAEYGFTERLALGIEYEADRASPNSLSGYGTELKFQYNLTNQGGWWLDSGIKGEYLFARGTDDAGVKLLLQRREGPARVIANIGLSRGVGGGRNPGVALDSKLQGSWHVYDALSPGLEWHADYGNSSDIGINDRTGQYVGPILTGTLFETETSEFSYVAGYYRGLTAASAEDAVRLELEYQFAF